MWFRVNTLSVNLGAKPSRSCTLYLLCVEKWGFLIALRHTYSIVLFVGHGNNWGQKKVIIHSFISLLQQMSNAFAVTYD